MATNEKLEKQIRRRQTQEHVSITGVCFPGLELEILASASHTSRAQYFGTLSLKAYGKAIAFP